MFPTPDISHLTRSDYEHVYEPAEDTFLLLDALEKEIKFLKSLRPLFCVEVGSGSGVVRTFLSQLLQGQGFYLCTDINPHAADVSQETSKQNNVDLNIVVTDLVSGILPRLGGEVDVLVFNPPYVVTASEEVGSGGIESSWAGGKKGREVTDRFLPSVSRLLSPHGVFYLVAIKENDQDEISRIMANHGLQMEVVLTRRSGPEFLSILKFRR